jgi:alpha-L-fucosidase
VKPLRLSVSAVLVALALAAPAAAQQTQFESATWETLRARAYPEWFTEGKLGIFIHWGVYSVPAWSGPEDYAEWFLRGLQTGDSLRIRYMRDNYGEDFEYEDFAPLFKAELFDPGEWARLFRQAGARYVVLVSKHHDGYALWPSAFSPGWNSVEVGPGRDLVGELSGAVRAAGLRMGLYFSLGEWTNELHRWYTDPPETIGLYVDQHLVPQFRELVAAYRPDLIFSDGEWLNSAEQLHSREMIGWYFDTVGPDAVVNDRWGAGSEIGFRTPEYSSGIELTDRPWTEVRGIGRSFGLNRNEKLEAYMTPEALVHFFAAAVAGGGGMILNVGPGADGQIPLLQQERLRQLGAWLAINGEAIYGSNPWRKTGEQRQVELERTDPAIDFYWNRNGPGAPIREDDFTAEWSGYLEPPATGDYTFSALTDDDDGVRVWVDGRLVVDEWAEIGASGVGEAGASASGAGSADPTVRLVAGTRVPIRVEYRERKVTAFVRLEWSGPGVETGVVPRSILFSSADLAAGNGLAATYRSLQQYLAYTQKDGDLYAITFEWPDGELKLPIAEPTPGTRVSLLGHEGDLPWRYADGQVLIDLSGVPSSAIPGRWAWTVRLEGYAGTADN